MAVTECIPTLPQCPIFTKRLLLLMPRQSGRLGIRPKGQTGGRFASGKGLQDALITEPTILFQIDEIDGMLQSINKARDARLTI